MTWYYYAAVLTFCSLCSVLAQDCAQARGYTFYEVSPQPTSDPFTNNVSTLGPSCTQRSSTSVWECYPTFPFPVLIDGQLGEIQNPPSASAIHAWNRSQQEVVTITIRYSSATQVRHIRLYFYHVPSMCIGLPDIAITAGGASQSYYVTGNQNLSSTDTQRRMVVLSFSNALVSIRYEIQFTFGTSSEVDWLLLSEVEMCTLPNTVLTPTVAPELVPTVPVVRSSDNVSPNLTLSCTVSGEGRFRWEWNGPQNPEKVWFSDFTRTSTAEFTGIRGLTSVDTGYSCRATYYPTIAGNNFTMSVSRNIDVLLNFSITTTTTNVIVPIGNTVSLSCEASGYLPSHIVDFTWLGRDSTQPINGSIYTITTMNGSGFLQNGGSSPVPSIISHLSFVVSTSMLNEPFSCQFQGRVLVLFVTTISSPVSVGTDETTTFSDKTTALPDMTTALSDVTTALPDMTTTFSSQVMAPELPRDFSFVILIATSSTVIIIFLTILAVIVCIAIAVLYLIHIKRKQSSVSDPIYELPSDKVKDTVIMKESVAYAVITEAQKPYVMSKCSPYEL